MRIEDEIKLDYCDVLIRPKRSVIESRKDVVLEREFIFQNGNKWKGVPIVAANMDTVGTVDVAKVLSKHNMLTCLSKHHGGDINTLEIMNHDRENMALSFGLQDRDMLIYDEWAHEASTEHPFFCLDVANGYTQKFIDFVKEIRERWPEKTLIAGNVVTAEMTEALILAGADIIKVGIGPGSVCTTRKITGVGYPQLSDFVMLGGILAGHDECTGEVVTDDSGASHKVFYGMSSTTAMDKHSGGVASYRASEGKTVKVPYRGALDNTIQQILGGIRSACTYSGAKNIKQLPKCTTFVRVNRQLNTVFGD